MLNKVSLAKWWNPFTWGKYRVEKRCFRYSCSWWSDKWYQEEYAPPDIVREGHYIKDKLTEWYKENYAIYNRNKRERGKDIQV